MSITEPELTVLLVTSTAPPFELINKPSDSPVPAAIRSAPITCVPAAEVSRIEL